MTSTWSVMRPGSTEGVWGDSLIRGHLPARPPLDVTLEAAWLTALPCDTHTHGRSGYSVSGDALELAASVESYLECGVGQVQLSTVTLADEDLRETIEAVRQVRVVRPELVGLHLEGPFLSAGKRGAHDPKLLQTASLVEIQRLVGDSLDVVTAITLDPQAVQPGVISWLVDQGVTVAIGHSEIGYDQALAAFDEGATVLTHAFNAMVAMSAREPSPVLAAIRASAWIEVIADGHHVHPELVRMLFDLAPHRIVLVTDSMSAAGLKDGQFSLGSLSVTVIDGVARTKSGALAGSTLSLPAAVTNVASWGVPADLALAAATTHPREAYSFPGGDISAGQPANLALWSQSLELTHTITNGRISKVVR